MLRSTVLVLAAVVVSIVVVLGIGAAAGVLASVMGPPPGSLQPAHPTPDIEPRLGIAAPAS